MSGVKRVQLIPLDDVSSLTSEMIERVVSTLPPELQKKATQLLTYLSAIDLQVTSSGQISYVGQSVGSSLTDLLTWVLSTDKSTPAPLDYMLFTNVLKQADLPDDFLPKIKEKAKPSVKPTAKEWFQLY